MKREKGLRAEQAARLRTSQVQEQVQKMLGKDKLMQLWVSLEEELERLQERKKKHEEHIARLSSSNF